MYQEFYQLHDLPFENTPDPRFFFASEQHREALAAIEYTIRLRKGYVLITGAIGSGKTTIGRTMCEHCAPIARIVHILHGHGSNSELLRQILRALEVDFSREDEHVRLLERLRERLLAQVGENRPVVLFVDDAQTLTDQALEELRLLSNFDTSTQKLVQIVLVGQPELRLRIRQPRFDALRQRIVMAKQLQPMNLPDTQAYIHHRLAAASLDPDDLAVTFTPQALLEVHRFTGGTPRLINFTCDNCLLLGFVRETREIIPAMVQRVVADMLPNFEDAPASGDQEQSLQPQLSLTGSL